MRSLQNKGYTWCVKVNIPLHHSARWLRLLNQSPCEMVIIIDLSGATGASLECMLLSCVNCIKEPLLVLFVVCTGSHVWLVKGSVFVRDLLYSL